MFLISKCGRTRKRRKKRTRKEEQQAENEAYARAQKERIASERKTN